MTYSVTYVGVVECVDVYNNMRCVSLCVCVCIYIYIYMCVCVCVCVCSFLVISGLFPPLEFDKH